MEQVTLKACGKSVPKHLTGRTKETLADAVEKAPGPEAEEANDGRSKGCRTARISKNQGTEQMAALVASSPSPEGVQQCAGPKRHHVHTDLH